MTPRLDPPRRSRLLALVCGVLGAAILASLLLRLDAARWSAERSEGSIHRDLYRRFGLSRQGGAEADSRFKGAVAVSNGVTSPWFGTYSGGEGFTGTLFSTPFILESGTLKIPVLGYPDTGMNHLALEISTDHLHWSPVARYDGPNPGPVASTWLVETSAWDQKIGRLVLTQGERTQDRWIGVGAPHAQTGPEWLSAVPRDYGRYGLAALAIAGLLLLPGLIWIVWTERTFDVQTLAFLALPGIGLLAGGGLATWLLGRSVTGWILPPLFGGMGLAGIVAGVRLWRRPIACEGQALAGLGCYGCVVASALLFGVAPIEVAGEFYAHSTQQARMAFSPPDSEIPYLSAAYFLHHYDGREKRIGYFGTPWSVASRGPLLPWTITSLFVAWDVHLTDPPTESLDHWPATRDGYSLARSGAILTNGLVILAGAWLAGLLLPQAYALALLWLCVCPELAINLDFTWPKLWAAYFLCLAVGTIVRGEGARKVAGFGALAFAAHPVGGLYMVPVGFLFFQRSGSTETGFDWGRAAARSAGMAACLVALLLPWIAYGLWIGVPNSFAAYPLGGGNGFERAPSVAAWLQTRISNAWCTLVPGAFVGSGWMREWGGVSLSATARWVVSYAKTLPGAVGYVAYPFLAASWCCRGLKQGVGIRSVLFFLGGIFVLLYWGYSGDGLGRNCLDPMVVLMIAYAAATLRLPRGIGRALMAVTALESLSVRWLEVSQASPFVPDLVRGDGLWLLVFALLLAVAPLVLVWKKLPVHPRPVYGGTCDA